MTEALVDEQKGKPRRLRARHRWLSVAALVELARGEFLSLDHGTREALRLLTLATDGDLLPPTSAERRRLEKLTQRLVAVLRSSDATVPAPLQ